MNAKDSDKLLELVKFSESMKDAVIEAFYAAVKKLPNHEGKESYILYALAAASGQLIVDIGEKDSTVDLAWFEDMLHKQIAYAKKQR